MKRSILFSILCLAVCAGMACAPTKTEAPLGAEEDRTTPQTEAHVPDIQAEEVNYQVGDVSLTGFVAWDAAARGPRPGVLVVHEWWGHNDYARDRARQLAEMGYVGMAIDMYGGGKLAEHPEDAQKFMMEVVENIDTAVERFDAARELLEARPETDATRTAAIGYCFGGAVVLHMARIGTDLNGVAAFHADLTANAKPEPGSIRAKIRVFHGADDPFVSPESIDAFKQEMADAGASMVFRSYPGAVHSFTNPAATELGQKFELPLAYDAAADLASWAELEDFLGAVFLGSET